MKPPRSREGLFVPLETDVRFCSCRFTQLGLLRLLTAEAVMGNDALSQVDAWTDAYLAAFADSAQLTIVTFDRAFRGRAKPLILLAEWSRQLRRHAGRCQRLPSRALTLRHRAGRALVAAKLGMADRDAAVAVRDNLAG